MMITTPTPALKQEDAWAAQHLSLGRHTEEELQALESRCILPKPAPALPVLSPRAKKTVDNIFIAIGYCIGGIILAALAIVFGLFFGQLRRDYRHNRYINNRYG